MPDLTLAEVEAYIAKGECEDCNGCIADRFCNYATRYSIAIQLAAAMREIAVLRERMGTIDIMSMQAVSDHFDETTTAKYIDCPMCRESMRVLLAVLRNERKEDNE